MTKKQLKKLARKTLGYMPYVTILDLFKEDEEIPEYLVKLLLTKRERKPFVIRTGEVGMKVWQECIEKIKPIEK